MIADEDSSVEIRWVNYTATWVCTSCGQEDSGYVTEVDARRVGEGHSCVDYLLTKEG